MLLLPPPNPIPGKVVPFLNHFLEQLIKKKIFINVSDIITACVDKEMLNLMVYFNDLNEFCLYNIFDNILFLFFVCLIFLVTF